VYGANQKLPFSVQDPVDHPISLYAATKRAAELMSYTYHHLFQIPATGLRFFTVYGPWGRPDMSAFIFTKAIFEETELPVFNGGDMRRNFSYIDDIVSGTVACLDKGAQPKNSQTTHPVYNLGNNQSAPLMDFIHTLEKHIGKKAKMRFEPMQAGDVKETIADISDTTRDFGFLPKTNIEEGLKNFVDWYRSYYEL
jgi:UDP-glucuronate 4-epimerase